MEELIELLEKSTAYIKRIHLTMRTLIKRLTRKRINVQQSDRRKSGSGSNLWINQLQHHADGKHTGAAHGFEPLPCFATFLVPGLSGFGVMAKRPLWGRFFIEIYE